DGELLSDLLDGFTLSIEETVDLAIHIVTGVRDLHAAGIIHRDLKPANIMLRPLPDGERRAVIFDLGLSRSERTGAEEEPKSITASAMTIGTLMCMAPEQVVNAHDATIRSDLYAVGAILYRAIAGRFPFEGDDHTLARRKLIEEAPPLDTGRIDPIARG